MIIVNCDQRSKEWLLIRSGVPTASRFDQIVTTSGERSKSREKYLYELAGQSISGVQEVSYQSKVMEAGLEREAEARALYELVTGKKVKTVGVCFKDGKRDVGCSPDGMIGKGLLEVKCPLVHTHVGYILKEKLPWDYFQQTQGQIYVTGAPWVDFMSYYPGLKPLIVRVKPDKKFLGKLDPEIKQFNLDLKAVSKKIRK